MNRLVVLALLTSGCNALAELLGDEPNCSPRHAYFPDADGDGVGEPGALYVGCSAPEGWVDVPPSSRDTADTDPGDTDPGDTDPSDTDDTDPSDTAPGDTDGAPP